MGTEASDYLKDGATAAAVIFAGHALGGYYLGLPPLSYQSASAAAAAGLAVQPVVNSMVNWEFTPASTSQEGVVSKVPTMTNEQMLRQALIYSTAIVGAVDWFALYAAGYTMRDAGYIMVGGMAVLAAKTYYDNRPTQKDK